MTRYKRRAIAKEVTGFDIDMDPQKDKHAAERPKYTREGATKLFAEIKAFLAQPTFEPLKPFDDFKIPFPPKVKKTVPLEQDTKTKDYEDLFERMRPKATGAYLNSSIPLPKTKAQAQELFSEIATFLDNSLPPFRLTGLNSADRLREKFAFPKRITSTTTGEQEPGNTKQVSSTSQNNCSRKHSKFTPKFPDLSVWKAFGVKTKATDEAEVQVPSSKGIKNPRAFNNLSNKKRKLPEPVNNTKEDNKQTAAITTTIKRFNPRSAIKNFSFEEAICQAKLQHEKIKKLKAEKRMMKKKEEKISSSESESGYSSGSVPSPTTSISSPSVASSCSTISSVRHINPNGEEITIFNSRDYSLYRQQARKRAGRKRANTNPLKLIVEGERPAAIDQHRKVLDWRIRQLEVNEQCPMTPPRLEEGNRTPIPVDNQAQTFSTASNLPDLTPSNQDLNSDYYDFLGLESLELFEPYDVDYDGIITDFDVPQPVATPTTTIENDGLDFDRLLDEHMNKASQNFIDFDLDEFLS